MNTLTQNIGYNTSNRYKVVTTQDIVDYLIPHGYTISTVQNSRVNKAEKQGFQKHIVRLRHPSMTESLKSFPEIVIVNSYDKSTSVKIMLGIYRLICSNGLIVGSTFEEYRVRHVGANILGQIKQYCDAIIASASKVNSILSHWNSIQLPNNTIDMLYRQAASLVMPDNARLTSTYTPRRLGDTGNDLWSVFNVVQETAVRNGFSYLKTLHDPIQGDIEVKGRTRAIKAIDRLVDVNKQLWNMAERLAA